MPGEAASMDRDANARAVRRRLSEEVEGSGDVGWRRRAALEEPTASDADDSVHEDSDDNGDVACRGGRERRCVSGIMWVLLRSAGLPVFLLIYGPICATVASPSPY